MDTTTKIMQLFKTSGVGMYTIEKQIGLTRGTVNNWSKSKNAPSAEAISKIASYFDVSTDYLLGLTDKPQLTELQIACGELHGKLEQQALDYVNAIKGDNKYFENKYNKISKDY